MSGTCEAATGGAERRQHERKTAEVPMIVRAGEGAFDATSMDLSSGGACLNLGERKLKVGDRVGLAVTVPGHRTPMDVEAEVRWATQGARQKVGVMFHGARKVAFAAAATLALSLAVGCNGVDGEGVDDDEVELSEDGGGGGEAGSDASGSTEEDGGGPGGGGAEDAGEDCGGTAVAATPMKRLTHVQYANTLLDLFGGSVQPSDIFPETAANGHGYSNSPEANIVSSAGAEQIMRAAESAAAQVVDNLGAILSCPPDEGDACAREFINDFGPKAFRRPLTDTEEQRLFDLYLDMRAEADFGDAIGAVVMTVLQSPQFLYLTEPGSGVEASPGVIELTDYEIASRLSYLIWDSMPDEELFAAAAAGQLRTVEQIQSQAERMFADQEKSGPAITRFYREWMEMGSLDAFDKDPSVFPDFDQATADAMDEEFDRFVEGVVYSDDPSLASLLTSPTTEVDATMAQVFGVAQGGDQPGQWRQVDLDGGQRGGLLTRPALLAQHSTPSTSSPIFRGKLVRTQMLCQPMPAPPADALDNVPEFPPGASEREKSDILLGEASCSGCHQLMNPVGLGFENYDAIGRWQGQDSEGEEVDASGEVNGGGEALNGFFDGATELQDRLAESDVVRDCVAQQWYQHAFGVEHHEAEQCAVEPLQNAFEQSGGDLAQLVIAITKTDSFRYRRAEEV